jgi:hypothetical protein
MKYYMSVNKEYKGDIPVFTIRVYVEELKRIAEEAESDARELRYRADEDKVPRSVPIPPEDDPVADYQYKTHQRDTFGRAQSQPRPRKVPRRAQKAPPFGGAGSDGPQGRTRSSDADFDAQEPLDTLDYGPYPANFDTYYGFRRTPREAYR